VDGYSRFDWVNKELGVVVVFVIYDKETQRVPIKVWLQDQSALEPGCLEQAVHLASLPFVHHHVSLMPDTHQGYGMPIGGVIATKDVIIPNAVGVDIGCGMGFVTTNIQASLLKTIDTPSGKLGSAIVGCIMRNIPTGMNNNKTKQLCSTYELCAMQSLPSTEDNVLLEEFEEIPYQIKSLGGGRVFASIQFNRL
jgi:tRNA-splicing ligase RtcB